MGRLEGKHLNGHRSKVQLASVADNLVRSQIKASLVTLGHLAER